MLLLGIFFPFFQSYSLMTLRGSLILVYCLLRTLCILRCCYNTARPLCQNSFSGWHSSCSLVWKVKLVPEYFELAHFPMANRGLVHWFQECLYAYEKVTMFIPWSISSVNSFPMMLSQFLVSSLGACQGACKCPPSPLRPRWWKWGGSSCAGSPPSPPQ